jgi:hypothetical protein
MTSLNHYGLDLTEGMSGSSLRNSTTSQAAGKKISWCNVVCKIVNLMVHQNYLHTMQNTNSNKLRYLRFKFIVAMFLKIQVILAVMLSAMGKTLSGTTYKRCTAITFKDQSIAFETLKTTHPMTVSHLTQHKSSHTHKVLS